MKHPHADILHAIAEGRDVQIREISDDTWESCQPNLFFANMNAGRRQYEYRVKPQTILINGQECPAPDPENGDYILHISAGKSNSVVAAFCSEADRNKAYAALIRPFGADLVAT